MTRISIVAFFGQIIYTFKLSGAKNRWPEIACYLIGLAFSPKPEAKPLNTRTKSVCPKSTAEAYLETTETEKSCLSHEFNYSNNDKVSLKHFYSCNHVYVNDTQVYICLSIAGTYLSLAKLGACLGDFSRWMTNKRLRLNADKIDFLIIYASRQCSKLTLFFPTTIFVKTSVWSELLSKGLPVWSFSVSPEITSLAPC